MIELTNERGRSGSPANDIKNEAHGKEVMI
jgi:hypothetical protein